MQIANISEAPRLGSRRYATRPSGTCKSAPALIIDDTRSLRPHTTPLRHTFVLLSVSTRFPSMSRPQEGVTQRRHSVFPPPYSVPIFCRFSDSQSEQLAKNSPHNKPMS